jgi:hypothetical protein
MFDSCTSVQLRTIGLEYLAKSTKVCVAAATGAGNAPLLDVPACGMVSGLRGRLQ